MAPNASPGVVVLMREGKRDDGTTERPPASVVTASFWQPGGSVCLPGSRCLALECHLRCIRRLKVDDDTPPPQCCSQWAAIFNHFLPIFSVAVFESGQGTGDDVGADLGRPTYHFS